MHPLHEIIDENRARENLLDAWWPGGPVCPRCNAGAWALRARLVAGRRVACAACGAAWTWKTASVWAGSHLTAAQICTLYVAFGLGASAASAALLAGVDAGTARVWRGRVNAANRPAA